MGFTHICACVRGETLTTIRAPAPGAAIILRVRVRLDYYLDSEMAIRAPALQ